MGSSSRRTVAALVVAAVVLVSCEGDDTPAVETARVGTGEVVETVAAGAEIEPAGQVAVSAPASGEVVELSVEDGDDVEAGELLLRIRSETVDLQVAQAESALAAADAMAGAAGAGAVDLSPLLSAVRGQLEAVLPPVLDGLEQQAAGIEQPRIRARLQRNIAEARASYRSSVGELRAAEEESRGQVEQASAAQRRAAEAQREQARLALEAAEARDDELVLVAPADGVVELGRAGAAGTALEGLDALAGGDGPGGVGDLQGLAGSAGEEDDLGPLAEGATVSAGQRLLTIYDLSSFGVRVEVDEIDVVDVAPGQRTTVLVDAYPDVELPGRVGHVALSPERAAEGGAVYEARITLLEVPEEVRLRVGLTASAEIATREVEGQTVVPTSALLRRGRDDLVRVVSDGVVHDTPVQVDATGETRAAVRGDLEVGDRVVTTGVERLSDGDRLP